MKDKPLTTIIFIAVIALTYAATFAAGAAAGHFHGKAQTLERFVLVAEHALGPLQ